MHPNSQLALIFAFITIAHANIPLPKMNIAQSKGITAGMGLGTMHQAGCKTLWTWTGYGNYSYNSSFSAGPSIKFFGGNLDSANNLVSQRYSLEAKFKRHRQNHILFVGPIFSFDNTNLSILRNEFTNIKDDWHAEIGAETKCRDTFMQIGSSIGYQSGAGFVLAPNWAFTLGHNLDLTSKGFFIMSFSSSLAFNLRDKFEKLIVNTKNSWMFFEYSPSLIKSNATHYLIWGLAIGF
jgi:hypothetical protein